MKNRFILCIVAILSLLLCVTANAESLMQIYYQALENDPTFKSAEAQYLATKENLPIARAAALPNLGISGATQRQVFNNNFQSSILNTAIGSNLYNTSNIYSLNLTQPLFNLAVWNRVRLAGAQVRQADATFSAAVQDLMLRTGQAYFAVLSSRENLHYTRMQKKAVARQLKQSKEQYDVGLIAITDVNEAQASYDVTVANEIAAKFAVDNAVEALRRITGKSYKHLMGANDKLPLVKPNPNAIEQWVETAQNQNYSLLAAIAATEVAQKNVAVQDDGHFPVISGTAQYEYSAQTNPNFASGQSAATQTQFGEVGVSLALPVYQGGLVNAQTRQAQDQYQQSISNMEFTHRQVIAQTRNSYLGVLSGISKIQADRASIVASESSLRATEEGYRAGTRTMLDVLNQQSALYQAQQAYAQDQYNYLTSILQLKQAAGTLSGGDLAEMSAWMRQVVNLHQSYIQDVSTNDENDDETVLAPVKQVKPPHKKTKNKRHHSAVQSKATIKLPTPSLSLGN
jgi:outer membrane protein